MRFWKVYVGAIFVILLVIGGPIYWVFFGPYSQQDSSLQFASAQLVFSAVATMGVVFSLLYATHAFRMSLASPAIKLTLDEMGATKKSIDHATRQTQPLDIPIYACNTGNRVATTYQLELRIPDVFERYLVRAQEGDRLNGRATNDSSAFAVSFYNNKTEYTCFINKYVPIGKLRLRPDNATKPESSNLKIAYEIFGDWGAPQKGTLELEL